MVYPSKSRMSAIISRMIGSSSTTKTLRAFLFWFIVLTHFNRCVNAREMETKDRTLTWDALFKPESATHCLDVAATDVETEAGSAYWSCQRARGANKLFENFLLILSSDAFTLIAYAYQRYGKINALRQ